MSKLPTVEGFQVVKESDPSFCARCPSCHFKQRICGSLEESFTCMRGILEGPLYKTDGCNILCRGTNDNILLVTSCSIVVGENKTIRTKAAPKIKESAEEIWKAYTSDRKPLLGDKVRLYEWDVVPVGSGAYFFEDNLLCENIDDLCIVKKLSEESPEVVLIETIVSGECDWWPVESLEYFAEEENQEPAGKAKIKVFPS